MKALNYKEQVRGVSKTGVSAEFTRRSSEQPATRNGLAHTSHLTFVVQTILSCFLFVPLSLGAQLQSPAPGSQVRFWVVAGSSVHTAHLEQLTSDSLILESCATCTTLRYARTDVSHIEVFHRLPSGMRTVQGFGWGGLIGLVVGVIGASTCNKLGDGCDGAILLVPAGAILGGLIGATAALLSSYKWEPVK